MEAQAASCFEPLHSTSWADSSPDRVETVSAGPGSATTSSPSSESLLTSPVRGGVADPVALTGQPCGMCSLDCDGSSSVSSTDEEVTSVMKRLFHTRNRKVLRTFLEGRSRLPCTGAHAECRGQLLRMFEGALKEK